MCIILKNIISLYFLMCCINHNFLLFNLQKQFFSIYNKVLCYINRIFIKRQSTSFKATYQTLNQFPFLPFSSIILFNVILLMYSFFLYFFKNFLILDSLTPYFLSFKKNISTHLVLTSF